MAKTMMEVTRTAFWSITDEIMSGKYGQNVEKKYLENGALVFKIDGVIMAMDYHGITMVHPAIIKAYKKGK